MSSSGICDAASSVNEQASRPLRYLSHCISFRRCSLNHVCPIHSVLRSMFLRVIKHYKVNKEHASHLHQHSEYTSPKWSFAHHVQRNLQQVPSLQMVGDRYIFEPCTMKIGLRGIVDRPCNMKKPTREDLYPTTCPHAMIMCGELGEDRYTEKCQECADGGKMELLNSRRLVGASRLPRSQQWSGRFSSKWKQMKSLSLRDTTWSIVLTI